MITCVIEIKEVPGKGLRVDMRPDQTGATEKEMHYAGILDYAMQPIPLFLFGIWKVLLQRMTDYKYPTSIPNGVTYWICVHRCGIAAKKGNDTTTRLWANGCQIEFPFYDRLIGYSQQCSNFRLFQATVNACQPKVLAERLRVRRSPFQNAPINRNRRELCDNFPTTNTQQGQRRLLPVSAFPPPRSRRAALRSR